MLCELVHFQEYLSKPRRLCFWLSWFVCLLATLLKKYEQMVMKFDGGVTWQVEIQTDNELPW